jgi:hypothetical protein
MDDLDHHLPGRQACQNILSDRPFPNFSHKFFNDLKINVRFQEGEFDLTKGFIDVLLIKASSSL